MSLRIRLNTDKVPHHRKNALSHLALSHEDSQQDLSVFTVDRTGQGGLGSSASR
jgi:hypothetical protein